MHVIVFCFYALCANVVYGYSADDLLCSVFARNIVSRFSEEQIDRIVQHILEMDNKVSGQGEGGGGLVGSERGRQGGEVGCWGGEEREWKDNVEGG